MQTYNLSVGYRPMLDSAGNWQLQAIANYYMISFSQKQKVVYTSCVSVEEFDFVFDYYSGSVLLNWATLDNPANKDLRANWKNIIHQTTRDDLSKANNYFGHDAKPTS